MEALLQNGRHMVAFFEKRHVPAVRQRQLDRRHPGRPAGRRYRRPVGRARSRSTPAGCARTCGRWSGRSCTRRRSWAWASWPGPDLQAFLHTTTSVRSFFHAAWRVAFHVLDLITYRRGMQLVNGPALIARLVKSADDARRHDVGRFARDASLTTDDGGAVTGAVLQRPDGPGDGAGPQGCAAGRRRFPERRRPPRASCSRRTPTGKEHWTLAPKETTGDGVNLGESVGGQLDTTLASPAAWCPVSLVTYRNGRVGHLPAHRRPRQARPDRGHSPTASGSSTRPTATTSSPPE